MAKPGDFCFSFPKFLFHLEEIIILGLEIFFKILKVGTGGEVVVLDSLNSSKKPSHFFENISKGFRVPLKSQSLQSLNEISREGD